MNLNDLYKPHLNHGQQTFYKQFLDRYTDMQIDELWDITVEGHCRTSPPTIGELKKFAREVTPIKIVNSEQQQQLDIKRLTEEVIFSTRLGKLSLKQGWAHSYLVTCRESGIPSQDDDVLLKFQQGQHDADMSVYNIQNNKDVFSRTLVRFRNTMRQKNKEMKAEFAHLLNESGTQLTVT